MFVFLIPLATPVLLHVLWSVVLALWSVILALWSVILALLLLLHHMAKQEKEFYACRFDFSFLSSVFVFIEQSCTCG